MPSIVDPAASRHGAGTVTRGLLRILQGPGLEAAVDCVAVEQPPPHLYRIRQSLAVARSLASSLPAKPAYTYSSGFRDRVLRRLRLERCDLVMLNGSDLLWLEPLLPAAIPRLLIAHNIEHLLLEEQAAVLARRLPPLRPILRWEHRRMERYETAGIRSVGNVLFLSSFDAAHHRGGALAARVLVTPPLFSDSAAPRRPRTSGPLRVGFLGHMAWWPNRRGLAWFLSKVFPRVGAGVHLHLFGEGTQHFAMSDDRVSRHGPIDDLADVWGTCDLMICPVVAGGGVCTKLAEAVYHGVPTIATSLATRGLPLTDDPCLTVSDSAEDWIARLASPTARTGERISSELSCRFAVDTHREAVQRFVRDSV
jgi:glycosyltransferase involved in cell wall biosynthesis